MTGEQIDTNSSLPIHTPIMSNNHVEKAHITNGGTNGVSTDQTPQKPQINNNTSNNAAVLSWDYDEESECGPHNWPVSNGQRGIGHSSLRFQSPVDLHLQCKHAVPLTDIQQDPLHFVHYERPIVGEFVNNGHSGGCFYLSQKLSLFQNEKRIKTW
ncbi:putative carbonic anhydrase 5 precursor [Ditylenchus destructor]|nr:putative carbonic anhydrase 5 precursor [Ditylenchus destructor]